MKASQLKELSKKAGAQKAVEKAERAPFIPSGKSEDAFAAINEIPIHELVQDHFGWDFDGKNFLHSNGKKLACFVPPDENFLVHGGTGHLPDNVEGFSPFTFIKEVHNLDNKGTFEWFKEKYPAIRQVSEKDLKKKSVEAVEVHSIDSVFDELENESFDLLKTDSFLDEYNLFVRSAVLRIGAFSNIGKSKFGYFIAHQLLKKGYKGIVFSTEVRRSFVLANFVSMIDKEHFLDIMKRNVKPSKASREQLQRLEIYDRRHNAFQMEDIISKTVYSKPDFILIDFVQEVKDKENSQDLFVRMSNYAQEIQAFAQEANIMVIDLSQVANQSLRENFDNYGFVALKGSGDLLSSGDIIMHLRRNKKKMPNYMRAEIIKHKFSTTPAIEMYCDMAYGEFRKLTRKDQEEIKKQKEKKDVEEEFGLTFT